jgi:hypothetical protein
MGIVSRAAKWGTGMVNCRLLKKGMKRKRYQYKEHWDTCAVEEGNNGLKMGSLKVEEN